MSGQKPALTPQTFMSVNIVTDKYAVTVQDKAGQEYATVNAADGKAVCQDLPQAKWDTLPQDVRHILDGVHLNLKGGTEQVSVPS